jgi:hypothetical protein
VSLAAGAGFLVGLVHVFLGPDHLAALGVLSVRSGRRGVLLGFRWGVGHSAGLIAVGALALLLRAGLDFDPLAGWGEPLVGAALVAVGIRAILAARRHPHAHADPDEAGGSALAFGLLHGITGASHVWATLPALALPSSAQATAYLLAFCAGSILAMLAFSLVLCLLSGRLVEGSERGRRRAVTAAAAVSILVGLGWIVLPLAGVGLP